MTDETKPTKPTLSPTGKGVIEPQPEETAEPVQAAAADDTDDDSFLDDMIESIVEIPEKAVHWLLRPLWGKDRD